MSDEVWRREAVESLVGIRLVHPATGLRLAATARWRRSPPGW